jgi:hypothetical protein
MCCIGHQALRAACLFCQGNKYPVKDTEAASPDEEIIQSLVRIMRFLGVFPLKAVAVHINDPTQDTPVIHTWRSVRQREKCSIRSIWLSGSKSTSLTGPPSIGQPVNHNVSLSSIN